MFTWLRRHLSRFAIPHLGLVIVLCQAAVLAASFFDQPGHAPFIDQLTLDFPRIAGGEYWRVVSFVAIPPMGYPVLVLLGLYFFWLMSSALEAQWGTARFNLYLLIGWAMTVATAGMLAWFKPDLMDALPGNGWFLGSIFLAFAWLWPEFKILLFLIIPVKIKYLAVLTWLVYLWTLSTGSWLERALVLAAIANFLAFFGKDIIRRMRRGHREMAARISEARAAGTPFHRCAVCGITELADPLSRYRICAECVPATEYCMAHLPGHAHVTKP